jgi:hypothetical protein
MGFIAFCLVGLTGALCGYICGHLWPMKFLQNKIN